MKNPHLCGFPSKSLPHLFPRGLSIQLGKMTRLRNLYDSMVSGGMVLVLFRLFLLCVCVMYLKGRSHVDILTARVSQSTSLAPLCFHICISVTQESCWYRANHKPITALKTVLGISKSIFYCALTMDLGNGEGGRQRCSNF